MYRGKRDPMTGITVLQEVCQEFTDNSGMDWIEIFVPPTDVANMAKPWPSLAIPPKQVYYIDDVYNAFFVNAGAEIKLLYKTFDSNGRRYVCGHETDTTENILARYLQFEKHRIYGPGGDYSMTIPELYRHFIRSGMTMLGYVRTYCRVPGAVI